MREPPIGGLQTRCGASAAVCVGGMCPNRTAQRSLAAPPQRLASFRCISAASRTFGGISTATGGACALSPPLGIGKASPAHDPASVVGHGDRKGRKSEAGTGAGSQTGSCFSISQNQAWALPDPDSSSWTPSATESPSVPLKPAESFPRPRRLRVTAPRTPVGPSFVLDPPD